MESSIRREVWIWIGFVMLSVLFLFPCALWVRKPRIGHEETARSQARLSWSAVGWGIAPAVIFLIIAFSIFMHAWLGIGKYPRVQADAPDTIFFRSHALLTPISLLLIPVEVVVIGLRLRDLAARGANPLTGIVSFVGSLLLVWALIEVDPGNVFAWYLPNYKLD